MLYRKISWLVFTVLLATSLFGQIDFGAPDPSNSAASVLGILGRAHAAPISGTVQQVDGTPVKDARVQLINRATGQSITSAFTDAAGTFHLNEIPSGNYDIVAQSGVNEAREQVAVSGLESYVALRLAPGGEDRSAGNANSVSVKQMKVPEGARKLFQKAQELVRKNRSDEARKLLVQALQQYPQYAEATTLVAILKMSGNQVDAIDDLQTAIQYDPNYALAYIALGSCLNSQSRWDDAIRSLEEGLRLDPRSWQAYFELGKALTAKADYSKALAQLSRAETLAPKYAPIHLVRAYALLGMSNYTEAIPELETYVQSDPSAPTVSKARQTLDKIRVLAANSGNVVGNSLR